MSRVRGGISRKQLKAWKAQSKGGKKIGFNALKLIIMNEKNEKTGTFYSEEQASEIANKINRLYKHRYPYNGGKIPRA